MANHLAVASGNQAQAGAGDGSQRIDRMGLVLSTEGEAVDVADGFLVGDGFGAGEERY